MAISDPEVLYRSMRGMPRDRAERYAERVNAMMLEADATTLRRAQYLLAQIGHESVDLKYREEIASGAAYEGRRDLGNTQPGDGRRFKGRDWIQITGRHNYTALSRATGVDFVGHPTWLSDEVKHAGKGVVWYWTRARNCNAYCDRGDFRGLTRAINGGLNGYADRLRRLAYVKRLGTKILPERPDPLVVLTAGERKAVEQLVHERRRAGKEGWGSLADPRSPKAKAEGWKAMIRGVYLPRLRALGALGENGEVRSRRARYDLLKEAHGGID